MKGIFKILMEFCQQIIDWCGDILNMLLLLFPNSPFQIVKDSQFNDLLSQINYFIPIYEFIAIGQAWLIAVGIYYLYSVYARFAKAIE